MRAKVVVAVLGVVLVAAGGIAWWWTQRDTLRSAVSSLPFRYGFELKNTSNQALTNARLEVFAPAELPGRQEAKKLSANLPYTSERDSHGNHTLIFDVPVLPPFGVKSIVITGEVKLWSPTLPQDLAEGRYLSAEAKVQSDHEALRIQAQRLRQRAADDDHFPLAVDITRFVYEHVKDIGYLSEDRGALYALKEQQGDCTEYMSLFVALARANEIPARSIAGFLVRPGGGVLASSSYHNWAEFHDGRRWHTVDAQRNLVNTHQETYLTFRVLTEDSQLSTTQRFFAADPRLEIKLL